jgi:hypothetical protein
VRAEHGVQTNGALQQRAIESLDNFVVNVHADQPQEFSHLVLAQPADIESQAREQREVLEVLRAKTRRRLVEVGPEQIGKSRHALAKFAITAGIAFADAGHLVPRQANMLAIITQRDRLHVVAGQFYAQLEVFFDVRL